MLRWDKIANKKKVTVDGIRTALKALDDLTCGNYGSECEDAVQLLLGTEVHESSGAVGQPPLLMRAP